MSMMRVGVWRTGVSRAGRRGVAVVAMIGGLLALPAQAADVFWSIAMQGPGVQVGVNQWPSHPVQQVVIQPVPVRPAPQVVVREPVPVPQWRHPAPPPPPHWVQERHARRHHHHHHGRRGWDDERGYGRSDPRSDARPYGQPPFDDDRHGHGRGR